MNMKARDAQKLRDLLMITGFIIMLGAYIYDPLIIVGAIVAISCLIPDFLYNKCPECGNRLGRNEGKFCQHCGAEIDR